MYDEIRYETDGPVAIITLNRPDALNALTQNMMEEMKHAFDAAERDEAVVGIILTGEGRGFCAGMDMNALGSQASGGDLSAGVAAKQLHADPGDKSMGENFQIAFTYLLSVRKPIIAAINGPCAGLGMSFALLCDLRFMSESAKFVTAFSQRGLVAEHGQSWLLPRIVGPSRALDMLWTSSPVGPEEANAIGLVDRVFSDDELIDEAKSYIKELADSAAPISLMIMKRQVYRHMNMNLHDAMVETNELMAASLQRDDFKEGVKSFIERRPPKFTRVVVD
jgi:enoyl-CoA hydratase/carnithine racemase